MIKIPPLRNSVGSQMKYRLMVFYVYMFIALISPRTIGLIDARRSSNNYNIHGANTRLSREEIVQRGHSHNDYHQKNPLQSALFHGLRSVEVDVFPFGGELFVAHTRLELDENKTIQNM